MGCFWFRAKKHVTHNKNTAYALIRATWLLDHKTFCQKIIFDPKSKSTPFWYTFYTTNGFLRYTTFYNMLGKIIIKFLRQNPKIDIFPLFLY